LGFSFNVGQDGNEYAFYILEFTDNSCSSKPSLSGIEGVIDYGDLLTTSEGLNAQEIDLQDESGQDVTRCLVAVGNGRLVLAVDAGENNRRPTGFKGEGDSLVIPFSRSSARIIEGAMINGSLYKNTPLLSSEKSAKKMEEIRSMIRMVQ
jgi:hypothetical protein